MSPPSPTNSMAALPFAPSTSSNSESDSDTSLDSNAAPSSTPPDIPQSIVDRILWPSNGKSIIHPTKLAGLPPTTFNDDLIARVRASTEFAFHSTERLPEAPFAHTVTLYCPLPLGNSVVDSMVKLIANQVNSDVIELDALELVTGSLDASNDNVLRPLYSRVTPGRDELKKVEQFFTTLINVPAKHGPARRRILYLRDLGSIAMSAKPLMSILLRAIRNLRKQGGSSTIILMFGVAAGLKMKKADDSSGSKTSLIATQSLVEVTPIVDPSSLLPSLNRTIPGPDELAIDNLSPLAFADISLTNPSKPARKGLFSLLFNIDEANSETIWSTRRDLDYLGLHSYTTDSLYEVVDATMRNSPLLVINPNSSDGSNLQLLQQQALKSRVEAINRVVMRIIVRSNGACLSKDAENFWVAFVSGENRIADKYPRLFILPLSTAHLIASIAIGLSSAANTLSEALVLTPDHISRAYDLSTIGSGQITNSSSPPSDKVKSVATKIAEIKNKRDLSEKERMFISRIVQPDQLQKTGFLDIVIDPKVIKTLRSIISLPLLHPHHFSTGILAREALSGILLYGPPGTGKTLVCRALALEFGVPMLLVQPSDVLDSYIGESEKLAKAIFGLAHQIAPCIVFIDEVDAIFGARKSSERGSYQDVRRAMLTEFMQAMDGIQTKGTDGIVVVGATNRPFDLDTAILRRLPRRMMVDLPTLEEREGILKLYLRSETCAEDLNIHEMALNTTNFSGSDLKNLCVSAALEAVNDLILIPPSLDAKTGSHPLRVITRDHFARAFDLITPSFSYEANAQLYRWHQENGSVGQPGKAKDDTYQGKVNGADHLATFFERLATVTKQSNSG